MGGREGGSEGGRREGGMDGGRRQGKGGWKREEGKGGRERLKKKEERGSGWEGRKFFRITIPSPSSSIFRKILSDRKIAFSSPKTPRLSLYFRLLISPFSEILLNLKLDCF